MTRREVMQQEGLVLDDFLREMDEIRDCFHLHEPKFGLKEIEGRPGAKEALNKIVLGIVKHNGSKIYSQRHPLLSGISPNIYAERVNSRNCACWRIREKYLEPILRALHERALQTLVLMPRRDHKQGDCTPQLRTLASHLLRLADEANLMFTSYLIHDRIATYYRGSQEQGKERLFEIAGQMRWVGEALNSICGKTVLIRPRMDSPNPQVRFALFILGWLDVSANGPRYEMVSTLITAAFDAAKLAPPKWVERLAIEMHSKRMRRMDWIRESQKFRQQCARSQG